MVISSSFGYMVEKAVLQKEASIAISNVRIEQAVSVCEVKGEKKYLGCSAE